MNIVYCCSGAAEGQETRLAPSLHTLQKGVKTQLFQRSFNMGQGYVVMYVGLGF